MSMIDPHSPMARTEPVEEYFPSKVAYMHIFSQEDGYQLKQVFVDKIIFMHSSNSGDCFAKWASISFYKEIKRPFIAEAVYNLLKIKAQPLYTKVSLDKPIFSGGGYSVYAPEDKVALEDLYLTEEAAVLGIKERILSKTEKNYYHLFN